ncbi:MAG: hypothetical protein JO314_12135 [Acidobacteria bacterium]|nr:hypothetical protein [Acidobacteriota bacterium]
MGATTAFKGAASDAEEGEGIGNYEIVAALFQSIGDPSLYNGWSGTGNDPELEKVERRLQDEVKRDPSLIGIYAYGGNYIRIYQNKVLYSLEEDDSRYHERPLTHEEFEDIKSYLVMQRADELPPFLYCGGAYCTSKELLMIGRNGGRRVYIAGDDTGGDPEFFGGLNKYFEGLQKDQGVLKYALSRDIPGLEIVYANDANSVAAVWGDANGVYVAASDNAVRRKVEHEIALLNDPDGDAADPDQDLHLPPTEMTPEAKAAWQKHRWEGYGWFTVAGNALNGATQPSGVDLIPASGTRQESWKGRVGAIEIRAAEDGLYKMQAGRSTKLLDGVFSNAVVSVDGRWALVNKANGEDGVGLERVDLTTRREYPVVFENEYGQWSPVALLPGTNAILLKHEDYGQGDSISDEDTPPDGVDPTAFKIIDAATGNELQSRGEVRGFGQQTFRPLQHASRPGELWVAIPDSEKNATDVGTIDTRTYTFKPVLRVPRIKFDSMGMWVDEPHQKLYFTYRGHLLSLPLKVVVQSSRGPSR